MKIRLAIYWMSCIMIQTACVLTSEMRSGGNSQCSTGASHSAVLLDTGDLTITSPTDSRQFTTRNQYSTIRGNCRSEVDLDDAAQLVDEIGTRREVPVIVRKDPNGRCVSWSIEQVRLVEGKNVFLITGEKPVIVDDVNGNPQTNIEGVQTDVVVTYDPESNCNL